MGRDFGSCARVWSDPILGERGPPTPTSHRMAPQLADAPTRVGPPPSPKHPFDRDPLLIPQLFVDNTPRWYQRPAVLVALGLGSVTVLGVAVAIRIYTVEALARSFSALVSR
jgi:hypothetical protein